MSADPRRKLIPFWIGLAMWAVIFVPASLFGWDPHRLPVRLMSWLLGAGCVFIVVGLVRFFHAAKGDAKAQKRGLVLLGGLVGAVVLSAAVIMGFYASWHGSATDACHDAQQAESLAAMRSSLERAASDRARIQFFNESVFACSEADRAAEQLASGECPRLVPLDATCRCGVHTHPVDWDGEPGRARCGHYDDEDEHHDEQVLSTRHAHE